MLEHAVASGLQRVVAVTHADNLASQAVCRRLGMTHRGRTRAYYDAECELFELTAPTGVVAPGRAIGQDDAAGGRTAGGVPSEERQA